MVSARLKAGARADMSAATEAAREPRGFLDIRSSPRNLIPGRGPDAAYELGVC